MCPLNGQEPSKHAGSNLEVFGCGQLWPLRPACSKNRTRYNAGSNFPHPIWFCSSKEGLDHIVQNWPGSNLDGPSQVLAKRNWSRSKPMHKNHWAQFWQTTTGPLPDSPLSDLVTSVLPQTAQIILCKASPDLIWY